MTGITDKFESYHSQGVKCVSKFGKRFFYEKDIACL